MKKLLLFAALFLVQNLLHAQPWMPANLNGPMKYSEALSRYYAYVAKNGGEEDKGPVNKGKEVGEDKDHLFQVWKYYWERHLDTNGYMVPQVQTVLNWQKYMQTHTANKLARTTTTPSNWVFQGPDTCSHGYSGLGRINVVAFDPLDSNTFFIGSAGSNAWKTTDGGNTWTSMYDYLPEQGVADIKINPMNHNTIYIATGDADNGDSYSSGIIVSHDGGLSWSTTGLTWSPSTYYNAHSMLINPQDTMIMMLASTNGLYKSTNGGTSWTNINSGNFKQILYNPADTAIVYGTMYTDTSAQIMLSNNGGNTWNAVTNFTDAQRINMAVSPANPALVIAVASNESSGLKGIYNSTDSGQVYNPVFLDTGGCTNNLLSYDLGLPATDCSGQGWYDLCIAINPTNANEVVVGGVNTYYSADGGNTWALANQWYDGLSSVSTVHADKHCLAYNPLSGGLFETCDGGIYKNYGPVTTPWTDLTNGINITEFYRNAVDNNVTFCIGGSQDNGTKLLQDGGSTDIAGGDGEEPLINYGDPANIWYCSFPSGNIQITRDAGVTWTNITDVIGGTGAWTTPYVLHPTDTATLLLGYNQVYVTYDNGNSWASTSPVFDTNSTIDRIAIATTNPEYVYLSYYDYTVYKPYIQYTTNFGTTWQSITVPFTGLISDLVIDPKNENHIWVTCPWYGYTKLWSYNLTTNTWTNESGDLPDIPVDCMIVDTNSQTQYVGTDAAVYYKDTSMTNWALYNTNLPCAHVYDLHINYTTNQLWAASYGRGMWATTKADHTIPAGIPQVAAAGQSIAIYPNPATTQLTIQFNNPVILSGAEGQVTITNILGQTVYLQTAPANCMLLQVDVSALSAGVYFVKVNGNEVRKLVKE